MNLRSRAASFLTPERCAAIQRGIVETYVGAVGPRRARRYLGHVDPTIANLAPAPPARTRSRGAVAAGWLVGLLMGLWLGVAAGLVVRQLDAGVRGLGGVEQLLRPTTPPAEAPTTSTEEEEDQHHVVVL